MRNITTWSPICFHANAQGFLDDSAVITVPDDLPLPVACTMGGFGGLSTPPVLPDNHETNPITRAVAS